MLLPYVDRHTIFLMIYTCITLYIPAIRIFPDKRFNIYDGVWNWELIPIRFRCACPLFLTILAESDFEIETHTYLVRTRIHVLAKIAACWTDQIGISFYRLTTNSCTANLLQPSCYSICRATYKWFFLSCR